MSKSRRKKKLEIAIDKMIDLQDAGFGNYDIDIILEKLNGELSKMD